MGSPIQPKKSVSDLELSFGDEDLPIDIEVKSGLPVTIDGDSSEYDDEEGE
jgi:hypothetical protein